MQAAALRASFGWEMRSVNSWERTEGNGAKAVPTETAGAIKAEPHLKSAGLHTEALPSRLAWKGLCKGLLGMPQSSNDRGSGNSQDSSRSAAFFNIPPVRLAAKMARAHIGIGSPGSAVFSASKADMMFTLIIATIRGTVFRAVAEEVCGAVRFCTITPTISPTIIHPRIFIRLSPADCPGIHDQICIAYVRKSLERTTLAKCEPCTTRLSSSVIPLVPQFDSSGPATWVPSYPQGCNLSLSCTTSLCYEFQEFRSQLRVQ